MLLFLLPEPVRCKSPPAVVPLWLGLCTFLSVHTHLSFSGRGKYRHLAAPRQGLSAQSVDLGALPWPPCLPPGLTAALICKPGGMHGLLVSHLLFFSVSRGPVAWWFP